MSDLSKSFETQTFEARVVIQAFCMSSAQLHGLAWPRKVGEHKSEGSEVRVYKFIPAYGWLKADLQRRDAVVFENP